MGRKRAKRSMKFTEIKYSGNHESLWWPDCLLRCLCIDSHESGMVLPITFTPFNVHALFFNLSFVCVFYPLSGVWILKRSFWLWHQAERAHLWWWMWYLLNMFRYSIECVVGMSKPQNYWVGPTRNLPQLLSSSHTLFIYSWTLPLCLGPWV